MAEREEEKEKKKIQGGEELCLPLGFRFMPKDEELITYYLLPKLQGRQHVPNDRIIEDNVYTCHPNQLIEKHAKRGEKEWYFLSPRERKYDQGKRPARNTNDRLGRWKASTGSKDSSIQDNKSSTSDGTVYSERVLGYFRGPIGSEEKTKWLMQELMVPEYANEIDKNGGDNSILDDYVMCKIYVTPRDKGTNDDEAGPSCSEDQTESPLGPTSSGHDQPGHPNKLSEKLAGKRPVLQERQPPCRDAATAKRARLRNHGPQLGPPTQQVLTQTRPMVPHGGGNTQVPFGGAGRGLAAGRPMAMRGRPRAPMPMPMPMSAGYRGQAAAPMGYQYHGAQAPRPPAGYRGQEPVPFIGQARQRQAMATMRPSGPAAGGQAVSPPSASRPSPQQQQPQQPQPETEEMREARVIRQHMEEYFRLGRQGLLPSSLWPPPCFAAQQQRPTMPFAQQQQQQGAIMAFRQQQQQGPTMPFTHQQQQQPYFVPEFVNHHDAGTAGGMLPQFRLDNFYASEAAGEFQGCSWEPMVPVLATGDSAGAMAPASAEASVLSGAGNEGSGARDCIDGGGDEKRFVDAEVSPPGSARADGGDDDDSPQ